MKNINKTPYQVVENWTDNSEYSYLEKAEKKQFAWEFLRRNMDYQSQYEYYKDFPGNINTISENKTKKGFVRNYYDTEIEAYENESYIEYIDRLKKTYPDQYKIYIRLCTPKWKKFIYEWGLENHHIISKYHYKSKNSPGFKTDQGDNPKFYTPRDHQIKRIFDIRDGNLYVRLNVLNDIDQQLEIVKKTMIENHNELINKIGEINNKKKVKKDLIKYLRVYDAQLAGAKFYEKLYFIFKDKFSIEGWSPSSPEELEHLPNHLNAHEVDLIFNKQDSAKTILTTHNKNAYSYISKEYITLLKEDDSISLTKIGKDYIENSKSTQDSKHKGK